MSEHDGEREDASEAAPRESASELGELVGPLLPTGIEREIQRIRSRVHRFLALDGALSGTAAAIAVGVPAAVVLDLTGGPAIAAPLVSGVVGVAVAIVEARKRRIDRVRAAMVLDRLLDAKDRFASAASFAAVEDPPALHRLQIKQAAEFLEEQTVPDAPRPRSRAPRWMVAALVATGVFVPLHVAWPSMIAALRDAAGIEEEPRTAEEIADEAEALRRALERDPTRRVDQEINELEHELERQRERAQRSRAEALARAADAIERAMGRSPDAALDANPSEGAEAQAEATPSVQSVDGAPPEDASERLREAWEAAQAAREAWR
nr:hypothetical protein [Myxococcota bacterium]